MKKFKTRYYTEYFLRPEFPYDHTANMVWRQDHRGKVTSRILDRKWRCCRSRHLTLPGRGMKEISVKMAKSILRLKRIDD